MGYSTKLLWRPGCPSGDCQRPERAGLPESAHTWPGLLVGSEGSSPPQQDSRLPVGRWSLTQLQEGLGEMAQLCKQENLTLNSQNPRKNRMDMQPAYSSSLGRRSGNPCSKQACETTV
ncbi:C-type lectin domain family 4, member g, isoform CRA_b [Mus musculus]|nr:C-type lectin domain family 4, member g, isoform CRA_b [Mus musculus]